MPVVCHSTRPLAAILAEPDVLVVVDFTAGAETSDDVRVARPGLRSLGGEPMREVWRVPGAVHAGRDGAVRWSEDGDWLFASVRQPASGDIAADTRIAYEGLTAFLRRQPHWHVQRLWNFIDDINLGDGDAERYRQFCAGRLAGMGSAFPHGFPAGTAVGRAQAQGSVEIHCLAGRAAGRRIENPRQMSAWCYPRQYGPVPPSFARAMRLPGDAALAISGTAAIEGHASRHAGDLAAQLEETATNLDSLLQASTLPGPLDGRSLLRAYVRHAEDAPAVEAFLARRTPGAAWLLLQADICRRELLVEIDGWHRA